MPHLPSTVKTDIYGKKERHLLLRIFISPDERRLRTGWRLLIQSCLLLFLLMLSSIPLVFMAFFGLNLDNLDLILGGTASLIAITLSVYLSRLWLDRCKFVTLGLRIDHYVVKDIIIGTLISGIMMGLIFLLEWTFGWLIINSFTWNSLPIPQTILGLAPPFFLYIVVAWQEELLSRGYYLQNLEVGLSTFWGVVISSLVFSVLHILNPHISWRAILGITFAGFFLSYAYLRTRQLWLPIGLHLGWNFFQGPIFGFPVSGTDSFVLVNQIIIGPEIITGGLFGPEAGLILFPVLLVGTILIHIYSRNRGSKKHVPESR